MRRFNLPILFASAALFVGAGAAAAHKAPCDSGNCSGKHRDDGDDLSLDGKEHDGSALGSMSFGDDDLEDQGLGKNEKKHKQREAADHEKRHKNGGDDVAKFDDDDDDDNGNGHNGHKSHKNRNGSDDVAKHDDDDDDHHFKDDFDNGGHHKGKKDRPAGGVPVPEPSIGLLLAAPLLALGLRRRTRR